MFLRNKDCLNRKAVVGLHQEATRSVFREVTRFDGEGGGGGSLLQTFAQSLWQIAHFSEALQAAMLKRSKDLPAAVRRFAGLFNKADEFVPAQPSQVNQLVHFSH